MLRETDADRLLLARFICLDGDPKRVNVPALLERLRYLFNGEVELQAAENLRSLLVAAIKRAPNNPDAVGLSPILAARHLLNLEEYPRGDDKNAKIEGTDWTVATFLAWAKSSDVHQRRFDPHSIFTQRRAIAASAGGYGTGRSALIPSTTRSFAGISFATTVFAALDQLHQDEEAFKPFRIETVQPEPLETTEEPPVDEVEGPEDGHDVEADDSGEAREAAEKPIPSPSRPTEITKADSPRQESRPAGPFFVLFLSSFTRRRLAALVVATIAPIIGFALWGERQAKEEPTAHSAESPAEADGYWNPSWGPDRPTYTMKRPAIYPVFNSITDNPNYGDERRFVDLKMADDDREGGWNDDIWATPGDLVSVRIYVENSGADNFEDVWPGRIQDARLWLGLFNGNRKHSVGAILSATNADDVWDGATIHVDDNVTAEWVPGSLTLYSNFHPSPAGLKLDQVAALANGVLLGSKDTDGTIRPGYKYAMYIYAELAIKTKPESNRN